MTDYQIVVGSIGWAIGYSDSVDQQIGKGVKSEDIVIKKTSPVDADEEQEERVNISY
jgi:hypothetical protein